jgi:rod shape-determining protein MreD
MIMVLIISISSFLIESIFSNIFSFNLLFSLIALVICYPFFNNNDFKYYSYAFIFGLIYDLSYTDTFLFNAFLFLLVSFVIKRINLSLSNNVFGIIIFSLVSIIIYRFLTFISLVIVGYLPFRLELLMTSILSSLVINLIYGLIIYLTADYISKKYNILKID